MPIIGRLGTRIRGAVKDNCLCRISVQSSIG